MIKSAEISDCGVYRSMLLRLWDEALPVLVVIMLNPSTADAEIDDPTILNLIQRAKHNGYGAILVVNLCDFRSPHPSELMKAAEPTGPNFADHMAEALERAQEVGVVLVAWGNGGAMVLPGSHWSEHDLMMDNITDNYPDLLPVCIGLTKDGYPKHPLARGVHRVPVEAKFQPFKWDAPI